MAGHTEKIWAVTVHAHTEDEYHEEADLVVAAGAGRDHAFAVALTLAERRVEGLGFEERMERLDRVEGGLDASRYATVDVDRYLSLGIREVYRRDVSGGMADACEMVANA